MIYYYFKEVKIMLKLEYLKDLVSDTNGDNVYKEVQEMSEIMTTSDIRRIINKFLLLDDERKIKSKIEDLTAILRAARIIYEYSGLDTGMTDSEYDTLFHKAEKVLGFVDATPTITGGTKEKAHHLYKSLRGTLDKVYALTKDDHLLNSSQSTLDEWIAATERRIYALTGKHVNINNCGVILFPKFDGVSCVFEFNPDGSLSRALTRGSTATNEAQDITHIFKGRVVGPYKKSPNPYGLKTEIMMTNDDTEACNEYFGTSYKQSRSMVSSILNSDNADDSRIKYLKIIQLRWTNLINGVEEERQYLAPAVYDTPFRRCLLRERDKIKEFAEQNREVSGLRTDGVVIYLTDPELQRILGRENDKQKYEVAYKFTEEIGYTQVKDIHFSLGLFGTMTPIVDIEPIVLKGNTITSPSIGNYSRFKKLSLCKGDVVKIVYDIVPYLVFDLSDKKCKRKGKIPISAPTICSECGSLLEEVRRDSGIYDLCCKNPDCPAKEKGRILNYLNRIGIDGVGPATITILYDRGYLKNIKDLYRLEKNSKKIIKLKGLGATSVDYLISMVDLKRELFASDFMAAIGIKGISKATFRTIFRHIGFDKFMDYCLNDEIEAEAFFCSLKGIRNKTSDRIISGVKKNEKLIHDLEEELTIFDDPKATEKTFKVCFTKIRNAELEEFIKEEHGEVVDSITKETNLLVVPIEGTVSSKTKKAKQYHIPIIPIANARKYIIANLL